MFCCEIFGSLLYSPGITRFSFVLNKIRKTDIYYFVCQYRSLDPNDKSNKLSVGQIAFHFCPWCGKNLDELIVKNKQIVIELFNANRHLIL